MLLVAPQAQAATRQVGIDIPVQWYADASGQMTIDRFAALPIYQLATTRQIPSFGYSRKTWWLRSELPGTWFAGEPRWMQLGPSFVDHLTIYYRPLGSDAPWAAMPPGHSAPLATATSPARAICTTAKAC